MTIDEALPLAKEVLALDRDGHGNFSGMTLTLARAVVRLHEQAERAAALESALVRLLYDHPNDDEMLAIRRLVNA